MQRVAHLANIGANKTVNLEMNNNRYKLSKLVQRTCKMVYTIFTDNNISNYITLEKVPKHT